MLIPVKIDGKNCMALLLDDVLEESGASSYRNALVNLFETCISDDKIKDRVSGESFYYLLDLVKKFHQGKEWRHGTLTTIEHNGRKTIAVVLDGVWNEEDAYMYRNALINAFEACFSFGFLDDDDYADTFFRIFLLIRKFCNGTDEQDGCVKIKIVIDEARKGGAPC